MEMRLVLGMVDGPGGPGGAPLQGGRQRGAPGMGEARGAWGGERTRRSQGEHLVGTAPLVASMEMNERMYECMNADDERAAAAGRPPPGGGPGGRGRLQLRQQRPLGLQPDTQRAEPQR
eukprot:1186919-Prorocentrum_minimum.AAC.3